MRLSTRPAALMNSLHCWHNCLFPGTVAPWVMADARRRGQPLPYDAGAFIYFAWPVLALLYLFSTRGWRAFGTLGWFLLLYFGAAFAGSIVSSLLTMRS
jgi:hypothetical protein